jgi:hypothetical protein
MVDGFTRLLLAALNEAGEVKDDGTGMRMVEPLRAESDKAHGSGTQMQRSEDRFAMIVSVGMVKVKIQQPAIDHHIPAL